MLVTQSVRLSATPWTAARQTPLSMEFSSQEYWSGLPFPSPGDLPSSGTEPTFLMSPALAGRFFTTSTTWDAHYTLCPRDDDPISEDGNSSNSVYLLKFFVNFPNYFRIIGDKKRNTKVRWQYPSNYNKRWGNSAHIYFSL